MILSSLTVCKLLASHLPHYLLIPLYRQSQLVLVFVKDRDYVDSCLALIAVDYYLVALFDGEVVTEVIVASAAAVKDDTDEVVLLAFRGKVFSGRRSKRVSLGGDLANEFVTEVEPGAAIPVIFIAVEYDL